MMVLRAVFGYALFMVEALLHVTRQRAGMVVMGLAFLTSCKGVPMSDAPAGSPISGLPQKEEKVDPASVLSMTFEEAKKISPKSLEIPPFYKVAADEITVLKTDPAGQPLRVRARGKVYMQVDFREQLRSLGQEAYIESGGELIVRGKPLLQRGRSVVEGLSDYTVFYIKGLRLQVIGSHRKTTQDATGIPVVMPEWKRSWKEGPNPLLPALSPEDVPKEIRSSPLLPPVDGASDIPQMLPPETPPPPPLKSKNAPADAVESPDDKPAATEGQ
ncbi:hypothetical protein [Verrucomicrobium sp. BvORR106]|uniref:hypothetical protein n=1 Tax=Verrucomicrobium sp. BvORR106 TaxID=1403819 RepID=UPI002240E962|nr:hypothetical protein [Verrucomicrobium sp. BvORR106]